MNKLNCILLVDDDGSTNFLNYRIIKKLDITETIETAVNGDKAIQFITQFAFHNNNNAPEVILLDLNMPGADGIDFLTAFKKMNLDNKASVKIIILSTSSHPKDMLVINEEYLGYITKPLTAEKLTKALNIPARQA